MKGSRWFRRLIRDCKRISPHIRFVRVKYGFYRIYWKRSYVHEVYSEMPQMGYDFIDLDPRFENKKYYEEYEDHGELTRKIKNYVEGYWDSIDRIRTRVYLLKNNKEFNEQASKAYQEFVVK